MFIWFVWFMTFTARSIFSPVLPLIEDEFVVTHGRAASILAVSGIGYGLSLFFAGTVASFLGPKKSILLSTILSGVTMLLFSLARTFEVYYVLAFILGVALGVYMPSVMPLITDHYEERLWSKAIGIHGSAPSVSVFSAPFIALGILSLLPWRAVFVLPGIVFLLCGLLFYFVTDEVTLGKEKHFFIGSLLKQRAIWVMGILWIFSAGANIGLYLVIPLYLVKELSLNIDYANTIFGFSRLGGAILTIVSGFFVDRFSLKRACFFLVASTGILTMLLAISSVRWTPLFLFLQACISPTFFLVGFVALAKLFDRDQRGHATGFVVSIGILGTGVVPYVVGLSGDYWSFRIGIFLVGMFTALSSGLLYTLKELE